MAYRVKRNKKNILWPIKILRFSLPVFCFGFYGQIFLLFTTIFYCRKKESSTSPYLKCRHGHWFYKIKPFAGVAMFIHFLIAFITNTLYYKPIFLKCKTDLLKKSGPLPDILLLFTKMIVISIFIFDKGKESEHWAILSFLVLVTGINAYFTLFNKNRQNNVLLLLNNYFCLFLFSGFLILLIGKILKFLGFDGSIFLFFNFNILILFYIIFFKTNNTQFFSQDYKNINSPNQYLQYITQYYNIIHNKNNSRNFNIDLKSIISSIEEHCIEKDCPLKKYLKNLKNGLDCEYLLLQFCDKLFQYGISKFRGNIFLKNHYCIFLITDMNNKKKSLIYLKSINQNEVYSFSTKYNIYICRRITENYISPFINRNKALFEYRTDIQNFKLNIEKMSILYCEFLSSLLESKIQNVNNLDKINKIGHKILKLNKKTEKIFDNLMVTKTDQIEIIKLYSEYTENILKDEEKTKKCQKLENNLYNNILNDIHNKDFSNFNLDLIKENCNSLFLIISSNKKNLGNILDCSNNLSNIFGYQKNELIGKNINILIPKIFRKKHQLLVMKKTEENKLNFLEKLYKNEIYFPDFIEKDINGISKSNFLIPLNAKVYLINSEDNELVYLAEITRNIKLNFDLLKPNDITQKYCILTDNNFLIQSFTTNCLQFLNINYEIINYDYNIINYIKQFKNDYLSSINNGNISKNSNISNAGFLYKGRNPKERNKKFKNNIQNEDKQKIMNDLFNKKYNKKCRITWNPCGNNYENLNDSSIFESNIKYRRIKNVVDNEKELYMESRKIILDNELVGYYFFFSKIYNYDNKYNLDYKKIKFNDSSKNLTTKSIKKYQCTFKKIINNTNSNNINKLLFNLRKKVKRKSLEKMLSRVSINEEEDSDILSSEYQSNFKNQSKYSSNPEIVEVNEQGGDIIIDENYVPDSPINFFFDIKNNSFNCSKNNDNSKILNEILKNESNEIINICKKLGEKNIKEETSFYSSVEERESSENEESESNVISDSLINSNSIKESNTKKNKDNIESKNNEEEINSKKDGININNNKQKQNIKHQPSGNYYKVNLNHTHLLIYDFNREAFIEEKSKNHIISKVESIFMNLKNQNELELGKDEEYPYISIKNIQISKKIEDINKNRKKKEKENNNLNKEEGIKREDKIHKEKLIEIINNHSDEKSIKILKLISILFYFFLLLCGILNTIYEINYYHNIQESFNLNKNIAEIRYLEGVSIYYVRELVLLNFEFPGIQGGEYVNIPAKNKTAYISLIKEKLSNVLIKNQMITLKLFSVKSSLSKSSEDFFYKGMLKLIEENDEFTNDIHTLLIKCNADLDYLSSNFNQNNKDYITPSQYIYNNFNKYRIGFDILIETFGNEYENVKKRKIYYIIILVFLLLIFILIYIGITIYILSSNKKSSNYLEIIYNINSNVLKLAMEESLNLSRKLRKNKYNDNSKNEDENSISGNNKKIIDAKKPNNKMANIPNNLIQKNNKISFINNILYIIIFGFILLMIYFCFIYNFIHLLNIFKKTDSFIIFAKNFQDYQNNIIDIFNIYREYIFDDEMKIMNISSLDLLKNFQDNIYDRMREYFQNTEFFIGDLLASNPYLIPEMERNLCSYFITDYFNSTEDCVIKYKNIINNDFYFISNYFLEEIKIAKNIVKYKLENENIKGNLNNFNLTNLIEVFLIENKTKKSEFRLNIFNNDTLHSKLNLFFINVILPNFESSRNILFKFFSIDGEESFFIKSIIIYIFIVSLCFYGYLCLIIRYLNNQINQSKNILCVLPINILIVQDNNKNVYELFVNR